jgi:hypothetical protein
LVPDHGIKQREEVDMTESTVPASNETFDATYQSWQLSARTDIALEAGMMATYRLSWRLGDERDRLSILDFLFFSREANGYDLVTEGLLTDSEMLASHSAVICSGLILHGVTMPGDVGPALEACGERFPSWQMITSACLKLLEKQGGQKTDLRGMVD